MAPHSSTLAWKIPWMEEPGGLQSMGSRRVGYDRVTSLSLFTFMHWRRKCNPLQCSFLENPRDGGAWWAAVYGVAQSWTWLTRLSNSSSSCLLGHLLPYTSALLDAQYYRHLSLTVLSHVQLCNPMTTACQPPLFTGFFRQEYYSGFPFPPPGRPPHPDMELASPVSCIGRFFTTETVYLRNLHAG